MSLDDLLATLSERGLSVRVDADGKPRVVGKRENVTAAILGHLTAHREELIGYYRTKFTRRVVLLDEAGTVIQVLEECEGQGHHERIRHHAEQHPGQTVAGEWRGGKDGWTRFITASQKTAPDA